MTTSTSTASRAAHAAPNQMMSWRRGSRACGSEGGGSNGALANDGSADGVGGMTGDVGCSLGAAESRSMTAVGSGSGSGLGSGSAVGSGVGSGSGVTSGSFPAQVPGARPRAPRRAGAGRRWSAARCQGVRRGPLALSAQGWRGTGVRSTRTRPNTVGRLSRRDRDTNRRAWAVWSSRENNAGSQAPARLLLRQTGAAARVSRPSACATDPDCSPGTRSWCA